MRVFRLYYGLTRNLQLQILFLTRVLLGGLEGERLQVHHVALALLVGRVQPYVETQAGVQASDDELGTPRGHVANQLPGLRVVHLHDELLPEASVETLEALDVQRLGRLVEDSAVREGVGFTFKEGFRGSC